MPMPSARWRWRRFDISLGTGLSKVAGKMFRIGHLGDTNDLTVIATLAGVEMALKLAGVPHKLPACSRHGLARRHGAQAVRPC